MMEKTFLTGKNKGRKIKRKLKLEKIKSRFKSIVCIVCKKRFFARAGNQYCYNCYKDKLKVKKGGQNND